MKNIVIIGGSKGIGNEILKQAIENNKVTNISRNLPEVSHPNLTNYQLDVLSAELPDIDQVDVLIYCPGSINLKPIMSLVIDDFRNDFEINVIGAVKSIQKYLPTLKKGTNPSIILFSTVAAKLGMPFHASIATAKSGVEGLVKSLGAELAPTVRVNAIAPGFVVTEQTQKGRDDQEHYKAVIDRTPFSRWGNPDDIAGPAMFLASDQAAFITGQTIIVDGGYSIG